MGHFNLQKTGSIRLPKDKTDSQDFVVFNVSFDPDEVNGGRDRDFGAEMRGTRDGFYTDFLFQTVISVYKLHKIYAIVVH